MGRQKQGRLVTRPKDERIAAPFTRFTRLPLGDPRKETDALLAIGVDSRAAVDEMVHKAVAAAAPTPPSHGTIDSYVD